MLGHIDKIMVTFYLIAVEFTKTHLEYKEVLATIPLFKENDHHNKQFYDRFIKLIHSKFDQK